MGTILEEDAWKVIRSFMKGVGTLLKTCGMIVIGIIAIIAGLFGLFVMGSGDIEEVEIIFGTIMPAIIGLIYLHMRGKANKEIAEYREWIASERADIAAEREAARQAVELAARRDANTARIRRLEAQGEAALARVAVLEAHLAAAGVALPRGRGA